MYSYILCVTRNNIIVQLMVIMIAVKVASYNHLQMPSDHYCGRIWSIEWFPVIAITSDPTPCKDDDQSRDPLFQNILWLYKYLIWSTGLPHMTVSGDVIKDP